MSLVFTLQTWINGALWFCRKENFPRLLTYLDLVLNFTFVWNVERWYSLWDLIQYFTTPVSSWFVQFTFNPQNIFLLHVSITACILWQCSNRCVHHHLLFYAWVANIERARSLSCWVDILCCCALLIIKCLFNKVKVWSFVVWYLNNSTIGIHMVSMDLVCFPQGEAFLLEDYEMWRQVSWAFTPCEIHCWGQYCGMCDICCNFYTTFPLCLCALLASDLWVWV